MAVAVTIGRDVTCVFFFLERLGSGRASRLAKLGRRIGACQTFISNPPVKPGGDEGFRGWNVGFRFCRGELLRCGGVASQRDNQRAKATAPRRYYSFDVDVQGADVSQRSFFF